MLRHFRCLTPLLFTPLLLLACGDSEYAEGTGADGNTAAAAGATGKPATITIDGSSTVFPITEAVAEEFQQGRKTRVTIGVSGTGGGMKKLCAGEVAISGASRPIKPSEVELCATNGISVIELPVAYDGIAVVVHPDAEWVDTVTVDELKTIWQPEAQTTVMKWSDVRTGWPDSELHLFGAGVDSGTYDYFTKAIVGKEHASRGDFTSSEDDNVLVQGISTDKLALGFFGLAYYTENKDRLKVLAVDDGDDGNGASGIIPSVTTVADGTYQPLSRPIFIYVAASAAARPEVTEFVHYYLAQSKALIEEVGYIPLSDAASGMVLARYDAGTTGSLFEGKGSTVGATVEDLLK